MVRMLGHHRGVGFYIKTSINFVACSNLNVPDLENLSIKIRDPNSKLFLMILMFCGLTGKRNCWMLSTFMFHSGPDALEEKRHPGSIQN